MFNEKLKELRKMHSLTQGQLAQKLFIKQSSISKWENGSSYPDFENQRKLSEIFNVSIDYILGNEKTNTKVPITIKKFVKIPVLGYVQAGVPIDAVEEILDYEEIPEKLAATGSHFGLIVRGDSMEPRMYQGDVVIVREQSSVENGDIAVVLVNGDVSTIKKIKKSETGITLIALNPAYEPKFYSNKDILNLPVTIIGKVIEMRAKF